MTIKVGDKIPSVKVKEKIADGMRDVSLDELSKGKKIVLFAVPGAFTPTCSAKHVPGFIEHYDALKAKGVDLIACISVNDAFVMDAWGKSQNVGSKIVMLADGNGEFAEATGLTLDASGFGLGKRSARYAMVIEDGVVTKLHAEEGGGFSVSSAEEILKVL